MSIDYIQRRHLIFHLRDHIHTTPQLLLHRAQLWQQRPHESDSQHRGRTTGRVQINVVNLPTLGFLQENQQYFLQWSHRSCNTHSLQVNMLYSDLQHLGKLLQQLSYCCQPGPQWPLSCWTPVCFSMVNQFRHWPQFLPALPTRCLWTGKSWQIHCHHVPEHLLHFLLTHWTSSSGSLATTRSPYWGWGSYWARRIFPSRDCGRSQVSCILTSFRAKHHCWSLCDDPHWNSRSCQNLLHFFYGFLFHDTQFPQSNPSKIFHATTVTEADGLMLLKQYGDGKTYRLSKWERSPSPAHVIRNWSIFLCKPSPHTANVLYLISTEPNFHPPVFELRGLLNSLWPSDATWRWRSWSTLPDGTNPLPEPMLTYHQ